MTHDRAVEISGLRHHFDVRGERVQALEHIDLNIEPGQFVCLAGSISGARSGLSRTTGA